MSGYLVPYDDSLVEALSCIVETSRFPPGCLETQDSFENKMRSFLS